MLKVFTVLAVLVTLTFATQQQTKVIAKECMRGPSFWCRDAATARKCGVISFCDVINNSDSKIRFKPVGTDVKTVNDAPPVKVSFYYESLCPGCREVWLSQLFPTYTKLAGTGIVDFEFVPYGNAQEQPYGSSWYFTCQHGPNECVGNLIESCAISLNPDQSKHIPFLHCLEQYGPYTYGSYCAGLSKIDYAPIQTCANSDKGKQLEHQMALKTEQLNPPHQYVPWLTMNGEHSQAIQDGLSSNMLATICNAYTGTKPAACTQTTPNLCMK